MGKGAREACRVVVGVGGVERRAGVHLVFLPQKSCPGSGSGSSPAKLVFFSVSSILTLFFFFFSTHFSSLLQDAFPASSQAYSTLPSYFPLGSYNPLYLPFFFFFLITVSFPVTL